MEAGRACGLAIDEFLYVATFSVSVLRDPSAFFANFAIKALNRQGREVHAKAAKKNLYRKSLCPLRPLWLNSLRESRHRHSSHDGIRHWHLYPQRGPDARAPGSRGRLFPDWLTCQSGRVWAAPPEFSRSIAARSREHAERES